MPPYFKTIPTVFNNKVDFFRTGIAKYVNKIAG